MKLTCNVIDNNKTMVLNSPIIITKGETIEFDDTCYLVDKVVKFEFDSDGCLDGIYLMLKTLS